MHQYLIHFQIMKIIIKNGDQDAYSAQIESPHPQSHQLFAVLDDPLLCALKI